MSELIENTPEFFEAHGYMKDNEPRLREIGNHLKNSLALSSANQIRLLKSNNAKLEQQLAQEREANKVLKEGYEARGKLLACYRTGKRPSESVLKKLDKSEMIINPPSEVTSE